MAKTIAIIFLTVVFLWSAYGAVFGERAPVTDEDLIKQGYSCKSKEYGLMKNGEVNDNPSKENCVRILCGDGQISHETCGIATGPCIGPGDNTKRYPDCCFTETC